MLLFTEMIGSILRGQVTRKLVRMLLSVKDYITRYSGNLLGKEINEHFLSVFTGSVASYSYT